jgi:hypothetical protein
VGDASAWTGARGVVHLILADDDIAGGDTLDLAVASIALESDRGPGVEPTRTDLGRLHLDSGGRDVAFDRVPPGLYSAIGIELAGDAPVVEATLRTSTQILVIRTSAPLSLSARCEHGQTIAVMGTLHAGVDFAVGELTAAVTRHPLPSPVGGVIVIDEASAPAALEDFRGTLVASIHAECGADGL